MSVLLAVLAGVLIYAWRDVRERRARNDWDRTLEVAIVLVRVDSARAPVSPAALRHFAARVPALEARLQAEEERYRAGAPAPFHFRVFGPVPAETAPPEPASEGAVDLARQAYEATRYVRALDASAGLDPDAFDTRIYVDARRAARADRTFVDGRSEEGGRIGFVTVELDESMADLALFVVAHEVMHTLGAIDKYDASGRTQVPSGLAEPERVPRFPQVRADVMARNVVVAPGDERVPTSLSELGVGPVTAREIGWSE